ncbi:MAG: hypothetical protein R6X02_19735 [Enhygromyxa sp.]
MVSRTLYTNLILSLAFIVTACGDDVSTDSTTFGNTEIGNETGMEDPTTGGEGMEAEGDGDGDPSTGDGDGDPSTGDGDGDPSTGDGDGDPGTGDGDGDGDGECIDLDQDGYGENCDLGPDCDDTDYNNHTVDGCANCKDEDGDGHWVGCDIFDENKPGPDCNDNDFNVFTEAGCANCKDDDGDGAWVGCDQYSDQKPGPDCDDDNPEVGLGDAVEICNGLAENCAGEIDNAPADQMCPADGVEAPNVAPQDGWLCDPPAPGVDGCKIKNCVEQFFDLDNQVDNGCECAGTPRTDSLGACSDFPQGKLGVPGDNNTKLPVVEGTQLNNLLVGSVPLIDNGIGAGAEDWYWVEFPEAGNPGVRPNTGSIRIDFAQNDNNDYRFQVFRSCNAVPFDSGLATQFGAGAPPTREWWFFDNHPAAVDMPQPQQYKDNVAWPTKVYIRVYRVQNDKTCNSYRLQIQRVAN